MYFSPLTLTPLEMTALGSLLSLNEVAIALISAAVSWKLSAGHLVICATAMPPSTDMRGDRRTYGEVRGRGPRGLAVDIADEGFVDVAGADEAKRGWLEKSLQIHVVLSYL